MPPLSGGCAGSKDLHGRGLRDKSELRKCRFQNEKCRIGSSVAASAAPYMIILHFAFCVLHFLSSDLSTNSFSNETESQEADCPLQWVNVYFFEEVLY